MGNPLKPTDGRLKANRNFRKFMQRAVYQPYLRGDFKADATVRPKLTQAERIANAKSIDDLTDADLVALLRRMMLDAGIEPFSDADNLLAHLRGRIVRREQGNL